ncbi:MAG: nicotinate-nucleotide adenylyltransferase, partial [Bacteroidales bacterium]|nr:nicotinate-nucleotide adenylyltransferase [Bacteroidales bacterium]
MTPKTQKTGLFFGSFNPIHTGHLMIAKYMLELSDLSEIWFVISPHNPLKKKSTLLADHHRLALVKIAIEDEPKFRACDIEFKMLQPSYTIDTLTYLFDKYPEKDFILISGTDIFPTFHKWKNYEQLLEQYEFYVYPRPDSSLGKYEGHPKIKLLNAPMIEISSSFIRNEIKNGKDMKYFLPGNVFKNIIEMHFYEK